MNTIVLILVEIVVFAMLSEGLKKIRNFQFYYSVLEHSKYPLYNYISFKEKIAYFITRIIRDIPSFSFAPSDYDYWKLENEKDKKCTRAEKTIIKISLWGLYIRGVIGNVLCDLIIIVSFLFSKGYIKWSVLSSNIYGLFRYIFTSENAEAALKIVKYVQDNVNAILVTMIVLILLYVGILKRKKRKYSIEAIWAEEEADRVRSVAKTQKELEDTLLKFRDVISKNISIIEDEIRFYTDATSIKTEGMIECQEIIDKIKELLNGIVEVEGIQIYAQRNWHMYTQLIILEILPSLYEKKFINICRLSPIYIRNNCKTVDDLCEAYSYGVAFINGINRFLRFSYKKRKQYNRIVLHIADADYLSNIVEKTK
ncbi:MAG: hypothetical protein EGR42_00965 [[Eubacterium] rectale]|nr:hypothetical protein [Agathobacter rectalis]